MSQQEGLAATEILNKHDPTLLTWKEIKDGYGSASNFFWTFGLKPWNSDDCEEARSISREMKKDLVEESKPQNITTSSSSQKEIIPAKKCAKPGCNNQVQNFIYVWQIFSITINKIFTGVCRTKNRHCPRVLWQNSCRGNAWTCSA
jgi:hypothetical protein